MFDQYSQAENRLTHALVVALAEEPSLLRSFLRELAGVSPPAGATLFVEEQGIPREAIISEEDAERRGLPDAWIHDDDKWSVLIETKLTARLTADQLNRHRATARRRGYEDVTVLALTARSEGLRLPAGCKSLQWKQVYSWLRRHGERSEWAARVWQYLEIVEARMSEREDSFEGSLTEFAGFPFGPDRPWTYGEAKRVLRLAMGELRKRRDLQRQLGMDPDAHGRKAITGRDAGSVWDFIPLDGAPGAGQHTAYPHLTLSVHETRIWAHVTCPNQFRRRPGPRTLSREELAEALQRVEHNLRPVVNRAPGAAPWLAGLQRHYATQRSHPTLDASIEFDLRTVAADLSAASKVKAQPVWLEAAHTALQNRRPNFQVAVGLMIPYRTCTEAGKRPALDLIASSWIACKPFLDLLVRA